MGEIVVEAVKEMLKEEPDLYRKPTEEELAEFRRFLETNTKL